MFMAELHLRQPRIIVLVDCSLNIVKVLTKIRETGDLKHIYKNESDKPCFVHNAAYSDIKDLANTTISYKILK